MGLAASQARLLTITARLADNELRSQTINNAKMRLSTQSSQASENYISALNKATMQFSNYDATGASVSQPLTYNALTAYSSYNTQYGLINSSGQILVSEAEAAMFKNANGNLNKYLEAHGLRYTSTYFEEVGNMSNVNYPAPFNDIGAETLQNWYEQYGSYQNSLEVERYEESYAKFQSATAKMADYSEDFLIDLICKNSGIERAGNSFKLNGWNDSTSIGTMINGLNSIRNLNISIGASGLSVAFPTNVKNKLGSLSYDTKNGHQLKYTENYCAVNVLASITDAAELTANNMDSTIENAAYLVAIDNVDIAVDKDTGLVYNVVNNDSASVTIVETENPYDPIDENIASLLPKITYVDDNISRTYKYENNDNNDAITNSDYVIVNSVETCESPEEVKATLKRILKEAIMEAVASVNKGALVDAFFNNSAGTDNATIQQFVSDRNNFLTNIFTDIEIVNGDLKNENGYDFDGNGLISYDEKVTPKNLLNPDFVMKYAAKANLGLTDSFKTVAKEFMIDNMIMEFGEPKYAWIDDNDPANKGNADVKAQWYTNLFNKMQQGYKALENGLASSPDWIEYALESGIVSLEQVDTTFKWEGLDYKTCTMITEETDEAAVAKAEAEYNRAMKDIEAKDSLYDIELKNIDTEHSSLQTEYEVIQNVIKKNIDRTMKFNQSA